MDLVKTLSIAALIAMGMSLCSSSGDPKKPVASAGFASGLSSPDFEPVPIVEPLPIAEPESIAPQECKDGKCPIPSVQVPRSFEPTPIVSSVVVYESSPVMVTAPVVSSVATYSAPVVSYTYSVSDECATYSRPVRTPVRTALRSVASIPVRIVQARPVRSALARVFCR